MKFSIKDGRIERYGCLYFFHINICTYMHYEFYRNLCYFRGQNVDGGAY